MLKLFSGAFSISYVCRRTRAFGFTAMISLAPFSGRAQLTVQENFRTPPADTRIMMRWWFGPAATKPEITRELEQMKAAGIGGVEVADLYALQLDDSSWGFHNQRFLSDEHIAMLRFAGQEARRLGLRVDVTLGSGWPFGGPRIPVTQNAGVLHSELVQILPGENYVRLPSITAGEKLIAAFGLTGTGSTQSMKGAQILRIEEEAKTPFHLSKDDAIAKSVLFFIASRTGMVVKRPSVGAEGLVLDHYDPAAVANHLHSVGNRLLQAFPDQPPYSMFSDSLEVAGSNWTGDYLAEFQKRRGYDLLPHLPALLGDVGPETEAVRHDWGMTLTELVDERYMAAVQQWAHEHHTQFCSHTYGNPPVTLASYRCADLIEGEGRANPSMWREFSWTRWAASAAHIYDKRVVSSEAWTWLHSPSFRAVPIDMKAEADLHFLQGITQLIGHGWPYSPENVPEPGQRMYAAAAFNAHNPWSFIDPTAIDKARARYSVLVLPNVKRVDVAVYRDIEQYEKSGGLVIATGQRPSIAPGFLKGPQDDAAIQTISQRLFVSAGHLGFSLTSDAELSQVLVEFAKAEVKYDIPQSSIGFLHRKLSGRDLYFVANTSNMPQWVHTKFAHSAKNTEWWDDFTGGTTAVRNPDHIDETLEPYGSRLFYFTDSTATNLAGSPRSDHKVQIDLSTDWTLTVGQNEPRQLHELSSWADDPKFRYYCGTALHEKQITLNKLDVSGGPWFLDFGTAKPVEVTGTTAIIRTQALIQAPVRDVAEVTVNDHKVGVVWRPSYEIDIAPYLHVGTNMIRVTVANTGINELAGETQPSLRLLRALYGNIFQSQNMDHLVPLPSGLLGPVTLHSE